MIIAQHGHCRIPKKHPSKLDKWIYFQRLKYNEKKLREDRVKLMLSLGFVFNPRKSIWEDLFARLKKYALEHNGSTRVPSTYKADRRLGDWVGEQRRRAKPGAKYPVSAERIAKLKEIDVPTSA